MFFPDKIKSIKDTDRVLEIGPGDLPHSRADVFLEKKFDYIICSHVLEHVDDIDFFTSEMKRVGKRGYIKN